MTPGVRMHMETEVRVNVIKRSGEEVSFDAAKIVNAIRKANQEVDRIHRLSDYQIDAVAELIVKKVQSGTRAVGVEEIQDMVETGIMEMRGYEVAQKYVRYRYKREMARKSNTTDNGILALIDQMNEEVIGNWIKEYLYHPPYKHFLYSARPHCLFLYTQLYLNLYHNNK